MLNNRLMSYCINDINIITNCLTLPIKQNYTYQNTINHHSDVKGTNQSNNLLKEENILLILTNTEDKANFNYTK